MELVPAKKKRFSLSLSILLAFCAVYVFTRSYLTLETLQFHFNEIRHFTQNYLIWAILLFLFVRFFFAVISVPGTGILTLFAGAVFGFWLGFILVVISVSLGVVVAFLLSRHWFKDYISNRFPKQYQWVKSGSVQHGASFLFFLRLVEVAPSFLINSLFALTPMKIKTYFWVSLAGMLPGMLIFTNAGLRLTEIHSLSDLVSPGIILSFAAIGIIPLITSILFKKYQKMIN